MANTNPARGMRDFLPSDVRKRNYVIGIIKEVYESYGFEPLETPAVENIETLMGKYGDEGNQLIFKILKRGEKLRESQESGVESREQETPTQDSLSDLALRYDLTVPLARVVANNKNELPKFFKRYQIQPVWRADRPARGRFREFYQCDVDAIGSDSMVVEAEICGAVSDILVRLRFSDLEFKLNLNHRGILFGLLESFGIPSESYTFVLTAIDKLDKINIDGVRAELNERQVPAEAVGKYLSFVTEITKHSLGLDQDTPTAVNSYFLSELHRILDNHETGKAALNSVESILKLSNSNVAKNRILLSPWLARGLSYYTGAIMELFVAKGDFQGSLGGGGRYDGLIGMFGKEQIPACGFSLGLERILVVMDERGMFPPEIAESTPADVMVTIWSEETVGESLKLASELRSQDLRVTVYPEADKLGKQLKYADSIGMPWVCVLGTTELDEERVTVKNMKTGEQESVAWSQLRAKLAHE
jgi:histidyl-tRNA synthetase